MIDEINTLKQKLANLSVLKGSLGTYIDKLAYWKQVVASNRLRVHPEVVNGAVVLHMINDGKGQAILDGAIAAFVYEAYHELMPQIFDKAVERAEASVGEQSLRLQQEVEQLQVELTAIGSQAAQLVQEES